MLKHQSQKQHGFTLVEMVTVVGIIALLAVMAVANFRGQESKSGLRLGTEHFAGAINEAKNLAIAQKRTDSSDTVPEAGYGVHLALLGAEGGHDYIIFADNGVGSVGYYASGDEIISEENLPSGVEFAQIDLPGLLSPNNLSIIFAPPSGTVSYGRSGTALPAVAWAAVYLQRADDEDEQYTVTVYQATGTVEVEQE